MRLKLFPFLFFLRWSNTFKKAHLSVKEKLTLLPYQRRILKILWLYYHQENVFLQIICNAHHASSSPKIPYLLPFLLFHSSSFLALPSPFFLLPPPSLSSYAHYLPCASQTPKQPTTTTLLELLKLLPTQARAWVLAECPRWRWW